MTYVTIDADLTEIIDQDPEESLDYLRIQYPELLADKNLVENLDDPVEAFLENASDGQKAYLFNKMLKECYFSPMHTSITKLSRAIELCADAQGCHNVETLHV